MATATEVRPGIYKYSHKMWPLADGSLPLVMEREFPDSRRFLGFNEESLVPRDPTFFLLNTVATPFVRERGQNGRYVAVDVCTGGGIGAIHLADALLSNRDARVIATDNSRQALETAFLNFQLNALPFPPERKESDLLYGVYGTYGLVDFIFSNPPFLPTQFVPNNNFDPAKRAYDGGVDGLDCYRRLLPQAREALAPNGVMLLQILPVHVDQIWTDKQFNTLISLIHTHFPDKEIGLIGMSERHLRNKIVGLLIANREDTDRFTNLGTL